MLSGDTAAALASFDRALALDDTLQEARFNRGVARLRTENFAKASADFEEVWADEQSPLRADAAYHNGIALDRLGRTTEAESWLERAYAQNRALAAALLYVGILRERRGDLQGAGRAYLDYLEANPRSALAALRFGIAAQKAGRTSVAKRYLERVVAEHPASAEAVEARKFLVMWE